MKWLLCLVGGFLIGKMLAYATDGFVSQRHRRNR